jgi:SAM-dependent methyltransferase
MQPFEGYDPDNLYPFAMESSMWNVTYQAEALGEWAWKTLRPASVIDIGCGPGCYLVPFKRHGCEILGVDACPTAGRVIPGNFERVDLRFPYTPPNRFDLALCIEVAEHLEAEWADVLIETLAGCTDTILFSAAVPGQPGQYHVNVQSPEFWLSKFADRGYAMHPQDQPMRTFLETLLPATPERTDGCHSWLRDHSHLLQKAGPR